MNCPKCQSQDIESTCIGCIVGDFDSNTHTCLDCGYRWKQMPNKRKSQ